MTKFTHTYMNLKCLCIQCITYLAWGGGGGGGGVDSIILVKGNGDYPGNINWMERGYLARVILNTTTETIILAGRKNSNWSDYLIVTVGIPGTQYHLHFYFIMIISDEAKNNNISIISLGSAVRRDAFTWKRNGIITCQTRWFWIFYWFYYYFQKWNDQFYVENIQQVCIMSLISSIKIYDGGLSVGPSPYSLFTRITQQ